MSSLLFIVFGIVAGSIARAGGFVGSVLTGRSVLALHTAGIIGGALGALAVLATMGFASRHRAAA